MDKVGTIIQILPRGRVDGAFRSEAAVEEDVCGVPAADADLAVVVLVAEADAEAEAGAGVVRAGGEAGGGLVEAEVEGAGRVEGVAVPALDDFTVALHAVGGLHGILLLRGEVVTLGRDDGRLRALEPDAAAVTREFLTQLAEFDLGTVGVGDVAGLVDGNGEVLDPGNRARGVTSNILKISDQ